ncbi:hypothetical protein CBR_g29624 [Chara braunii]|uniref:RNA-binding S4 domain-containing protein n=1 Tax=Chara braunii TaxID=69332 RepID=A0A388LAZ3_CHABU|nr:hypothetical protein CBR_g29624 [Chara braunii]|eukprot:GBG79478.1 hypothetical protein CBR_g29624 [Chara braunii]
MAPAQVFGSRALCTSSALGHAGQLLLPRPPKSHGWAGVSPSLIGRLSSVASAREKNLATRGRGSRSQQRYGRLSFWRGGAAACGRRRTITKWREAYCKTPESWKSPRCPSFFSLPTGSRRHSHVCWPSPPPSKNVFFTGSAVFTAPPPSKNVFVTGSAVFTAGRRSSWLDLSGKNSSPHLPSDVGNTPAPAGYAALSRPAGSLLRLRMRHVASSNLNLSESIINGLLPNLPISRLQAAEVVKDHHRRQLFLPLSHQPHRLWRRRLRPSLRSAFSSSGVGAAAACAALCPTVVHGRLKERKVGGTGPGVDGRRRGGRGLSTGRVLCSAASQQEYIPLITRGDDGVLRMIDPRKRRSQGKEEGVGQGVEDDARASSARARGGAGAKPNPPPAVGSVNDADWRRRRRTSAREARARARPSVRSTAVEQSRNDDDNQSLQQPSDPATSTVKDRISLQLKATRTFFTERTTGADGKTNRLSKVLAAAGVASRRSCEDLIFAGKVTVNGQVITVPQTQVDPRKDSIYVNGNQLPRKAAPKLYFILNKPKGYICSNAEGGKRLVVDLFEDFMDEWRKKNPGVPKPRFFTVGRLDVATTGLLLVTNDGDFAQKVAHPSSGITKELARGAPERFES